MNRILNYCTVILISVLTISLGACTDEYEYTGAVAEGDQVYFSNALSSTVELNPNESSVQIPVNRIQRSGSLTVPIDVTIPENSKYQVSSEVTFADGDSVAYINISYDPSAIEYGSYDTITVAIKDAQYTTPYGSSSFKFAAGLSEWKTMSGNATFRDGIVGSLYGLDILTYQVEIQENVLTPGKYRIVSPFGEGTLFYSTYVGIDTPVFAWVGGTNTSIVINASDPDYVYVDGEFYTGLDDGMADRGQGALHVFGLVYYNMLNGISLDKIKADAPDLFGKLENGVITFPQGCMAANFDGSMTPQYRGNSEDLAIALPGYEITDYTSSFTYNGRFTDVAGNNYAQGTITLGDDVANAKYIIAADGDDINTIIDALADGSLDAESITESGDVSVAISESGDYTMVIVTFDAEGKMRGSSATSFNFTLDNNAADWQPVYSGTFTHNVQPAFITDSEGSDNFVGNPIINDITPSYSATMYQDRNNPSNYKIEPWITQEGSLKFTMDNQGYISFKDVDTGFSHQAYGPLYVGDAALLFGAQGEHTSGYDQEAQMFVFGTVYYFYINGDYGWFGGAYETFEINGAQGVSANNGLKIRNFVPKIFKNSSSNIYKTKMSDKIMLKATKIKGSIKRK